MKKLKVAFLAPAYYPDKGGVEKHLRMVAKSIKDLGHDIVVLVRYSPNFPSVQNVDGIPIYRLPRLAKLPLLAYWVLTHPKALSGVKVFHSHDFYPRDFHWIKPRAAWVHTFHGYEGYPLTLQALKTRQRIRNQVKVCFGVGHFIEKWYGTKLDKITYGGIENKIKPKPAKWNVVFGGRLATDTGFEDYIKGFALFQKKQPKATMLVVGNGPSKMWAEKFVDQEKLRVEFAGAVDDVTPYLAQAGVAFVSGYLTMLEAAVLAKPVIAHYGNPLKEDYLKMHPMANNFLIVSSPEQIAAAIVKPPDQKKIVAFQKWAKKQTWDKIAESYLSSYRKLTDEG